MVLYEKEDIDVVNNMAIYGNILLLMQLLFKLLNVVTAQFSYVFKDDFSP